MTARSEDTVLMPALRLLPPAAPDRQDRIRLTQRGRAIRDSSIGAAILSVPFLFEPAARAYAEFCVALAAVIPGDAL